MRHNLKYVSNRTRFKARLEICEIALDLHGEGFYSPYEASFLQDIRSKLDSRVDAESLGVAPWNPTIRQFEYLTGLARAGVDSQMDAELLKEAELSLPATKTEA